MFRAIPKYRFPSSVSTAGIIAFFICAASGWTRSPLTEVEDPANQRPPPDQTEIARALPADVVDGSAIRSGDEISSIPKKFQYALRVNLRSVYDDNIFLIQGEHVGDYYFAFEPDITLGYGDIVGRERNYLQLDYAPSFFFYWDHSDENAVQHLIHLAGETRFGHLHLTLTQDIELREGTNPTQASNIGNANPGPGINLDTASQTDENVFRTTLSYSYDLTGKTFLSGALHYDRSDYPGNLFGSQEFSGNIFMNYEYSPKLTIGLGATGGYNWVEGSNPDETFEQINGSISYQATGKLSFNGSVGVEFRQFQDSSSTYVSPVYDLSANYQPFDGTTITLNGSLRTENSAVLFGQDYSLTDISVSIRQRLLQRFYIGVTTGYEHSNYFSTSTGNDTSRTDNYYYVQPAIDVTITRYWTAGLYYLHRESDSSIDVFSFSNNQYGLRTSLAF